MSTKAKIGKDWVKCQVVLQETGETLHLTFAPGQARKKITAHVDGRTDTGWLELKALNAQPPYDATLTLTLDGVGVRAVAPAVVSKPVAPPKPVPAPVVAEPSPPPAPVVAEPEVLPPPPEEIVIPVVQDLAADTTTVAGGKRGPKRTT